MGFDCLGRRVFYKVEVAGEVTKHHRFVYDNYLCVQKLDALNNNLQINLFVWDPTEPIATRPLFMLSNPGSYKFFYTFDGNKNVSELVHFETRNGIAFEERVTVFFCKHFSAEILQTNCLLVVGQKV